MLETALGTGNTKVTETDMLPDLTEVFQAALTVKNLPANAGDVRDSGSVPGLRRSPGGGHGNPVYYSCLENPTD